MTQEKNIKKDYALLAESKYIKKWTEAYNETQAQKKLGVLKMFVEFIGKDPDTLILEHNEDMKRDDPIKITNIAKHQLLKFYDHLIGTEINGKINEKPISENSARQYAFSILSSFYAQNNVPIRFGRNEIPKERKAVTDMVWRNGEDRIAKEEKKKTLKEIRDSFALLRDRAILHCKISSGMDDVDLFALKVKDFEKGIFSDFNICYLEGNRKKSDIRFQTFFNGEACNLLKLYLNERKRKEETVTSDSWLFISNYAKGGNSKRIKANAFNKNLRETCEKLGITNITPKSLRKYFNTEVIRALHDDKEIVERMMGHVGNISAKYQQLFNDHEEFAKFYFERIEPLVSLESNNNKLITETNKEIVVLKEKTTKQEERVELLLDEKLEQEQRITKLEDLDKETTSTAKRLEEEVKELKKMVEELTKQLRESY